MANHASKEEFIEALWRMSDEQKAGIDSTARHYAKGRSGYTDGDDLLNEAIFRVAEGRRKWPIQVPIEVFIMNVMRSIVSGARQKSDMSREHRSYDDADDCEEGFLVDWFPSAEDQALAAERTCLGGAAINFARRTLADDQLALNVLEGLAADLTASDMREAFGVDKKQFHAARQDRKSTRLNSSHLDLSRMPSSA